MTATAQCARLNGAALMYSNADTMIHVARRAVAAGLDRSLCGYAVNQLRLVTYNNATDRSVFVLCPLCMMRAIAP